MGRCMAIAIADINNLPDSNMGTSGGEPRILLNALKPMLGITGDIKTPQEVMRIVGLMKDAEKLMSRCIYLNILKSTCIAANGSNIKAETMERFLTVGGWGVLNKWLSEFIKTENFPVLLELIEVLRCLPVTVELLKQGNTGKLIKQMTKLNHPDVKKQAAFLIRKWKNMIRGDNADKRQDPEKVNGDRYSEEIHPKDGAEGIANKRQRELQEINSETKEQPPEKKLKGAADNKLSKIKLIDPLSNKVAVESRGFLDSIMSVTKPIKTKKKKPGKAAPTTPPLKPVMPLDEIFSNHLIAEESRALKTSSPSSSPLRAGGDSPNVSSVTDEQEKDDLPKPESRLQESVDENSTVEEKVEKPVSEVKEPPLKVVKKKKKKVAWAEDEKLTEIFYFELEEDERAMMHHSVNFLAAKQMEQRRERQILASARRLTEDKMIEKIPWSRPLLADYGPPPCEPGEKSNEKYVQIEREQKVLADIFLTKASLPESPAEPDFDPEDHGRVEPRLIPHDEDGTLYPTPAAHAPHQTGSQHPANNTQPTYIPSSVAPVTNVISTVSSKPPDDSMSPAVKNIMNQLLVNKPVSNQPPEQILDYTNHGHRPPRPPGPEEGPQHFHPGNHGQPGNYVHPAPHANNPRPLLSMRLPDQRRGNFRGRPMVPRGGQRGGGPRPRFQGPPPRGGNHEEHYGDDYCDEYEEDYGRHDGGRGPSRGAPRGRQHSNRGKERPPPPNSAPNRGGRGRGRGGAGPRDAPQFCRHFMTTRGCRNGNICTFLHPGVNGPPL